MMKEAAIPVPLSGVERDVACERFSEGRWAGTSTHVPSEMELTIYVNRQELVTVLCTPTKLNCLVLGFLYSEGIISGMGDVASMRVCEDESMADVTLADPDYKTPALRTLTSGCGGGSAFLRQGQRVDSDVVIEPGEVLSRMKRFQDQMGLYRLSGGVHASALTGDDDLFVMSEDIGRHNTLDKVQGECLLRKLPTAGRVLLTTGRISSEMLLKAARMQVPVVVSRSSPTGRAISLGRQLGIAVVGYARGTRLLVYSHPERLGRSLEALSR